MQQANAIRDEQDSGASMRRSHFVIPRIAWFGFLLAAMMQAVCYLLVGISAGLFFAGIVFAVLLICPLVLTEERLISRLLIAIAIVDGIAAVWLMTLLKSGLTFTQWLTCYLVLISWGLSVLGMVGVVRRLLRRSAGEISSAITVAIFLAWLTLPVWLARWMPEHPQVTHALISVHPLFAVNGVVRHFGLWTERPIAYRYLLTLGQDLPTGMPGSIIPAFVFHFALGAVGLIISRVGKTSTDGAEVG